MSGHHLMPVYEPLPVHFVRAAGSRLWDTQGNEYLDVCAGVAVTNIGHSHPRFTAALTEQLQTLIHTSNLYRISTQEELAQQLCELSGMERVFFCNSGAEANETALKLARLHGRRRGFSQPLVVVMEGAFHGRTLATLAATGNPAVHQGFEPLMPGFVRVPFNDIAALQALASGPSQIAAVLLEPVQGEGGIRLAGADYLRQLESLCRQQDWLLMMDEIQSGMGRTGRWFACDHAGIRPDVMTLAKGLGNGVPLGACLAHGKAAELFSRGQHGSTFGGNPLACRAGLEVIRIVRDEQLLSCAEVLGQRLLHGLQQALAGQPDVVSVRGLGLMVGIELTTPAPDLMLRALQEQRLLINVTRQKIVRLLPPLICSGDDIDRIVAGLAALLCRQRQSA